MLRNWIKDIQSLLTRCLSFKKLSSKQIGLYIGVKNAGGNLERLEMEMKEVKKKKKCMTYSINWPMI